MEKFAIPGVGGLIEKEICGELNILIQERCKADLSGEEILLEISAER